MQRNELMSTIALPPKIHPDTFLRADTLLRAKISS